ncbi:MAG: hypothetical protein QF701_04735 [Nitrospinota bacterium]|jgi:TPR repeat protein|nr:hypothetical protein [Nitrospinota bacterium]MDP7371938.1 hypothetical protein [Nitrospinota bacterium]MDP7505404.1 hypothetical protein [Nitrospinota bacterium]MDP7662055.1 hypothetical protein [Nitrospinota bacterium]
MNLSRIQKHGLIVSVILAAGVVVAQGAWGFHWRIQEAQFGRGLKAYNNKDYAAALTAWRPLAENGMTDAQFKLGVLYANGQDVPKNMILSDMWLILAGGKIDGNKNRKKVEQRMTPKQIAEAKRLAREWTEKHQKK